MVKDRSASSKYTGALYLLFFIFLFCSPSVVRASSVNIDLDVLVCNANLVCEDITGETYLSCPTDCDPPPVATTTPNSGGGSSSVSPSATSTQIVNYVKESSVVATTNSAVLSFKTLLSSVVSVYWGKTLDYEIGSLAEAWYHNDFKVKLENLEPNTKYYFKIDLKDSFQKIITYSGEFTTNEIPDTSPPDSPYGFSAYLYNDQVLLNWKNPVNKDISSVRLVRSDIFYPTSPLHGKVVYEGTGTYVSDADVVPGKLYFYTIFSIDTKKNVSSGAIVSIYVPIKKIIPKTSTSTPGVAYDPLLRDQQGYVVPDFGGNIYNQTFCNSRNAFSNTNNLNLDISQLSVSQMNKKLSFTNGSIFVDPKYPISIALKSERIDKNMVRGLAICLGSYIPEVRRGYLFTYNTNTKSFEVEIPTSLNNRNYDFYIGMLQYSGKESVIMNGEFIINQTEYVDTKSDSIFTFLRNNIWILIVCIALGILLMRRVKRKAT
ncbi:MAG: hypothetical protein QG568_702 [Patescibacteria group bacterium]|nr:hypothetical protein [Patescibacteria group bacterium]